MNVVENQKKIILMRIRHISSWLSSHLQWFFDIFFFCTKLTLQNVSIRRWRIFQRKSEMGGSVLRVEQGLWVTIQLAKTWWGQVDLCDMPAHNLFCLCCMLMRAGAWFAHLKGRFWFHLSRKFLWIFIFVQRCHTL